MSSTSLLLASNSPRRRQLLALAGWSFDLRPVDIDESPLPGEQPPAYVLRLAERKARASADGLEPGRVILAADTTVADGSQVLGKPSGAAEAAAMLTRLRARTHQVFTAVAVLHTGTGELFSDLCATQVTMRAYNASELDAYIASGDPLDKAGAYAIQHAAFHPVERLEGCYANVVGLPLCRMQALLARAGFPPPAPLPSCPSDYNQCSFCRALARGEYGL